MSIKNGQILMSLSAFLLILASFFVSRKTIDYSNKLKKIEQSKQEYYLLAGTMRQVSDDLTKMARMYVITEDESYRDSFKKLSKIRKGLMPTSEQTSEHNYKAYQDVVLSKSSQFSNTKTSVSFMDVAKQSNLDDLELELLNISQTKSNELGQIEEQAINTIAGSYKDKGKYTVKQSNKKQAVSLLYGDTYTRSKNEIINPILKFLDLMEIRTKKETNTYRTKQKRLKALFNMLISISILLVLVLAIWSYRIKQKDKQKNNQEKDTTSSFGLSILESWPFVIATLTAIFAIVTFAWWVIEDAKAEKNRDIGAFLEFDLRTSYDSIMRWMEIKKLETSFLADNLGRVMNTEYRTINQQTFSKLNGIVEGYIRSFETIEDRKETFETHSNSKFIVMTKDNKVMASNINIKANEFTNVPDQIINNLNISPYESYYLNDKTTSSKDGFDKFTNNDVELIFGKMIDLKQGTYLLMVVPISEIGLVLKRSFVGSSGELYLVNSKGLLITESRFVDRLIQQGSIEEKGSSIGLRPSTNLKDPEAPLVKSVSSVILGGINEEMVTPYTNYLGDNVIGSWKWSDIHNFGLIREISAQEGLGGFDKYRMQTIYASTTTVTLILMLFSIFAINRTKLRKANDELAKTYETIKRQQDRVKRDMITGQQVQMSMLPDSIETEEFSIDAMLKPAQMVSGDFYDFSFVGLNKDKFYFSVGDVSGKGIPAALFMSATKAIINKVIDQQFCTSHEIVDGVNKELCNNNAWCVFVTLALCVVDLKSGKTQLTNAGHNAPMIKRANHSLEVLENTDGPVLGIFDDVKYTHQDLLLQKGDNMICYTDGVTEAQNNRQDFYGEDRLTKLLEKEEFYKPQNIIETVALDVTKFIENAPQFDDITLLSFEYK